LKIGIIVAVFVAAIAALIAFSTLNGPRYRVEVCMFFNGRFNCKTVAGRSESAALRGGIQNACADIASGVQDTMGCESSQPKTVRWLQRPGNQK
jgi:hypothetical protein